MHFCHEELYMIMAAIPGLTLLATKIRNYFHRRHAHCECDGNLVKNDDFKDSKISQENLQSPTWLVLSLWY